MKEKENIEERESEKSRESDLSIEERKKKIKEFFLNKNGLIYLLLIAAVILGIYIRSLPMSDHNGRPGLWDITTNTWTLGPDLDPFLFLRYAEIIINEGSLPEVDYMRNVPVGFPTSIESKLLPYMIAGTYKFLKIFSSDINIEFAGVIFPVIMFALTIVAFFFFTRELFVIWMGKKADIIALISTLFMIIIPAFLSRTIAGIPEKESAAFFFMFLSFYLFLKAWKVEKLKNKIMLSLLAGISTAGMALIWGAVGYVFITISASSFLAFILNKIGKKEVLIYSIWLIVGLSLMTFFSAKYPIKNLVAGIDTGLALVVLFIFLIDLIISNTNIHKKYPFYKLRKKFPGNIVSLISAVLILFVLVIIFFGPGFIIDNIKSINNMLIKPVTGRWSVTVAENRQPYFTEWMSSFGPIIRKTPLFFWLFFVGSIVLFRDMLKRLEKKDSLIITGFYVLFLFGLIFSRYSGSHILNGENFISKLIYYGSAFLLFGCFIYYYVRYYREEKEAAFSEINYEIFFLFVLFFLTLFTARSAVRLIMVLVPIAPIFVGYLIVKTVDNFKKSKEELLKIVIGGLLILILITSLYSAYVFYNSVKISAYNHVPSSYTFQWQKAMEWVRENTPEDAIFTHWWDYGYWVQSIGKRATTVDGGNAYVYWNYLVGRHVLTGPSESDALEFLYSHNSEYLLIDSTDIGKYTAYSSIGSDQNYDRFSWVPTMLLDSKQTLETQDGKAMLYKGGSGLDEDIIYNDNGSEIFLPAGRAGIGGVLVHTEEDENFLTVKRVEGIFFINGQQIKIPIRYVFYNGTLIDFKEGLNASFMLVQQISSSGTSLNPIGAGMYLSPRLFKSNFAKMYLFNQVENFELIHTEHDAVTESLINQGKSVGEFTYFNGIHGPIKIWKVNFPENLEINEEFLQTTFPDSIDWQF